MSKKLKIYTIVQEEGVPKINYRDSFIHRKRSIQKLNVKCDSMLTLDGSVKDDQ